MMSSFRNLFLSAIAGEGLPETEEESVNIDKPLDFSQWILGDIYGCLAVTAGVNIKFVEEDDDRSIPEQFYCELLALSKRFVDDLIPVMDLSPVLLFHSENFFMRFTKCVCLRLIKEDNPEEDFLKVMAYLLVNIAMAFKHRCYHILDALPTVLYVLLRDHLKTKFYEEDGFDDVVLLCDKLKIDEQWYESTVEEIRGHVAETLDVEMATVGIYKYPERPDLSSLWICEVESKRPRSAGNKVCPYCDLECIKLLVGVWIPRVTIIFPECRQM